MDELPEEPDFALWTMDDKHGAVEGLHQESSTNVHYLPCDLEYVANFIASNEKDLWRDLGEDEGDYDFETTKWLAENAHTTDLSQFPEGISWNGVKAPANMLQRKVEFKRQIENAGPFGKPVAQTSQRQRVFGCKQSESGASSLQLDDSGILVFAVDTLFKGFVYADCFRAHVLWTFSPLEPQPSTGVKGPRWVKAVLSTKVTFVKQISLSFVKKRIAKDNAEAVKAMGQTVVLKLRTSLAPKLKAPRLSPKKSSKPQSADDSLESETVRLITSKAHDILGRLKGEFNIWIGILLLIHVYTLLVLYTRPVCVEPA